MSRRRRGEVSGPSGFLVVDKPSGCTSHDVVDAVRRRLGTRRVGHLGTLDPLATGTLPLAVREATKLVPYLGPAQKVYRARLRLGVETDTLDADGEVLREWDGPIPGEAAIREACLAFLGESEQIPPMFSAVKQGGVPLYRLARQGRQVERKPRRIQVVALEVEGLEPPELEIQVICSAGTYIRTLAADIGTRLGCGAHLTALRRLRSGPFGLEEALTLDALDEVSDSDLLRHLIPERVVLDLPTVQLEAEEALRVSHGASLEAGEELRGASAGQRVAAMAPGGDLLALLELQPDRRLRVLRVLRPVAAPGGLC